MYLVFKNSRNKKKPASVKRRAYCYEYKSGGVLLSHGVSSLCHQYHRRCQAERASSGWNLAFSYLNTRG